MERRLVKSFDTMLKEAGYGADYSSDFVVAELQKAMANAALGPAFADVSALKLENLDSVMTQVLFDERHLKVFNSLPRVPSIQPFYQYNRRLKYGGGRSAAGFVEGGSPVGGVAAWDRQNATVRYKGVRGGVTHQVITTGMMGGLQVNPVEEENRNRTMELLEKCERDILFGLESIPDNNNNTVNYNGFLQQMGVFQVGNGTTAPNNVYDMAGQPITFSLMEDIAERLYESAYVPDIGQHLVFMSPFIVSDLSKQRLGTFGNAIERRMIGPGNVQPLSVGEPLGGFQSNYGYIRFEPSLFLQRVNTNRPLLAANEITALTAADAQAPAAPVTISATAANDATSLLPTATTYYYAVGAFNDYGESLGFVTAAATTSGVQKVTLVITSVTGATGYRIYRTNGGVLANDINGVNARWIADVPKTGGPGSSSATSFIDLNQMIPGTGLMLFIRPMTEDIAMPQMSPLIKFPIAIVSTTIEFFLLLYHTLVVKAPQRHFVVKNIGRVA